MGQVLKPEVTEAKWFLNRLDPDRKGIFTFQTFDDSARKDGRLARVLHGTIEQHLGQMEELQASGAGIFVMINKGDGLIHEPNKTCRCTSSVTKVRALFADLDGAPLHRVLESFCLPDFVVESSPGRWHTYWLTNDCPLTEFKKRQLQIAAKFGSDPKVNDLPRVLRLPGFWHQKAEPFLTHIHYGDGG